MARPTRPALVIPLLLGLPLGAPGAPDAAAKPAEVPVAAVVETTLATEGDHIGQFAFDGDDRTAFVSGRAPGEADHFTLVLDRPVAATAIAATTGRPGGADRLDAGSLEVSADGAAFEPLAAFAEGSARGDAKGRPVRAIRIKPAAGSTRPLVVREFAIAADLPVATFRYPVEFAVDTSDAPELEAWGAKVGRLCERAYPMINEELKGDGHTAPHRVRIALRNDYRGVAAAGGGKIVGSVKFFKEHPDDVGAMVHEAAHIVQGYGYGAGPTWLVEGVADYVRFIKYEPANLGPINPKTAHYNSSYRVSAAFLGYLADKYDQQIVLKLNALMRAGEYKESAFADLTGKPVRELDEEWRATLRR